MENRNTLILLLLTLIFCFDSAHSHPSEATIRGSNQYNEITKNALTEKKELKNRKLNKDDTERKLEENVVEDNKEEIKETTTDISGDTNPDGSEELLVGMEALGYQRGRVCYSDSDCLPGEACLQGIDTTGIAPFGVMPGSSLIESASRSGLLTGALDLRTCGPAHHARVPNYSLAGASAKTPENAYPTYPNPNTKQPEILWNLPAQIIPGQPSIFCNNPTVSMEVGEIGSITISGTDNDLFDVTIPTSSTLFIKVKDIKSKQKIAGTYEFLCDAEGSFTVKFAIEVNDGLQSIQKAINICMAQFDCTEPAMGGGGASIERAKGKVDSNDPPLPSIPVRIEPPSQPITITTVTTQPPQTKPPPTPVYDPHRYIYTPPESNINTGAKQKAKPSTRSSDLNSNSNLNTFQNNVNKPNTVVYGPDSVEPQIMCKTFYRQTKVGNSMGVSISEDVLEILNPTAGTTNAIVILVDPTDGADTTKIGTHVSEHFTYTCDEAGENLVYFIATAVNDATAKFDTAVCPAFFDCTPNRVPTVGCNSAVFKASGHIGDEIIIDVTSTSNRFFTATDSDNDSIFIGLQDADTKSLLWNISHKCKEEEIIEKSITVSAFDGDASSETTCKVSFHCMQ